MSIDRMMGLLLAALAAGCGGMSAEEACEQLCARSAECSSTSASDCKAGCADRAAAVERDPECEEAYIEVAECAEELDCSEYNTPLSTPCGEKLMQVFYDALAAYGKHPIHQRLLREVLKPLVARYVVYDLVRPGSDADPQETHR